MRKFSKGEKKKCKHYEWGKCLVKDKDCIPLDEYKVPANNIEDCEFFEARIVK